MLGIIGGSGLYSLENLTILKEIEINTPFGKPSSPIVIGKLEEKEVAFMSRHGKDHSLPPHLVPYRANFWAFKEVGVSRVLAISAVGGIKNTLRAGDFVIINDFLDFTKKRDNTYYEGKFSCRIEGKDKVSELLRNGKVVHVDVSDPYCPEMRKILKEVMTRLSIPYHYGGVYACTEGPRFESVAEIKMLKVLGADVVGMTGYPEVVLARELTMCYVSICVVANPAAGISGKKLTSEEVIEMMSLKEKEIGLIVREFVKLLPKSRSCSCKETLEGAEV